MLRLKLSTTKTISILYLLLGLYLFRAVPVVDEIHGSAYGNWYTSDLILIKAYHIPGYLWFLPFAVISVILWFVGSSYSRYSKMINLISGILFIILAVHIIDWLTMFVFCHEWGCSGTHLPTWRLFQ